ncbi:transposase family protein [Candidatus Gracilibacteria bacterium]|nr:transposase family protein [Candidatus Gracilibacteria bacterium]
MTSTAAPAQGTPSGYSRSPRRTRKIKALSQTRTGKTSDKRVADEEGYAFSKGSRVWKDSGFQGYEPTNVTTFQPKKRPPNGTRTPDENARNRAIARVRVRVEHAIGGAKVYRIAHDIFRNRRDGYVDMSFAIACGLHNLRCTYRP